MVEIRDNPHAFAVAEVCGLSPEAPEEHSAAMQVALARAGMLCLRMERPLTDEEFQAVASLFGPIKDPVAIAPDGSEFQYSPRKQIINSGFVMTDEFREQMGEMTFGGVDDQRPGLFETFHCDDTFTVEPARVTVLHARNLPPSGGGPTVFMDMRASYDLLTDEMGQQVQGLRVVYAHNNEGPFPPRQPASGPADVLDDVVHPLVRTHPIAGTKALFHDLDRAKHIEGIPIAEGQDLLRRLQEHAEANAPQYEHHWRENDVLVWDNASVQHKARGNFKLGESRRFWRYMVAAERPV